MKQLISELRPSFPVVTSEMRRAKQVLNSLGGLRPVLLTALFLLWLFMGKARAADSAVTLAQVRQGTDSSCGELERSAQTADGLARETGVGF